MRELILDRKTFLIGAGTLAVASTFQCRGLFDSPHTASMTGDDPETTLNSMALYYDSSSNNWNGWVVTPEEKQKLVKLSGDHMNVKYLEDTDLPGDDILVKKTENAQECAEFCSHHVVCMAFTFVKPDHPVEKKHNDCILKKKHVQNIKKDKNYTSGYLY